MKKLILLIIFLLFSSNILSQSLKDITAAGLDFFLKSDKARYLSNDQKTGLSILESLLSKQGDRDFQLELTKEGRTTINVNGVNQEVKILPGSDGGLYLVTGDKVYPINVATIDEIKGYSLKSYNKTPMDNSPNYELSDEFLAKAEKFDNEGKVDLAILNLKKSLSYNKNNYNAKRRLGFDYMLTKDETNYDLGFNLLSECLNQNPNDTYVHYGIGNYYFNKGEYEKSIQYFSNSINLGFGEDSYKEWYVYYSKAFAYTKLSKFELAIKDLTKAIHVNVFHCEAFELRAICYDVIGKKSLAERDREKYRSCRERFPKK